MAMGSPAMGAKAYLAFPKAQIGVMAPALESEILKIGRTEIGETHLSSPSARENGLVDEIILPSELRRYVRRTIL